MAHFGVQECPKMLKENSEKKKTVVFRKRISAKTTVFFFSVFKSVNLVGQGVVLCSYSQGVVLCS